MECILQFKKGGLSVLEIELKMHKVQGSQADGMCGLSQRYDPNTVNSLPRNQTQVLSIL